MTTEQDTISPNGAKTWKEIRTPFGIKCSVPAHRERSSTPLWAPIQTVNLLIEREIKNYQLDTARPLCFTPAGSNRVTSLAWNPVDRHQCLIGTKWGNIAILDQSFMNTIPEVPLATTYRELDIGSGPGGSVTAIKYDARNPLIYYTTSITGALTRRDMSMPGMEDNILECSPDPYKWWYTAVDYHPTERIALAGSSAGSLVKIHLDESNDVDWKSSGRAHKGKVNHIEFHPVNSFLFATSGNNCVRIWDLRKWSNSGMAKDFLVELPHHHTVNNATFNFNGGRMLTTDQKDQLRVYCTGNWEIETTIFHPHRQFQHLTPINAVWHPLTDLIGVGRYPQPAKGRNSLQDNNNSKKTVKPLKKPKPQTSRNYWAESCGVDFFSGHSGKRLYHIPTDRIPSLVQWNCTGDMMAIGMNSTAYLLRFSMETHKENRSDSDDDDPGQFHRRGEKRSTPFDGNVKKKKTSRPPSHSKTDPKKLHLLNKSKKK